ncbi:hypothetical protein BAUCODRAFT_35057 [Baudoinia panamericana UAMH 10762]|uniref:Uncharacterized protein n=1 Tax=Baudoinia panamericana (strain UAMH 10762) TaxID=717646 RepID=M2LLB7_BAUPA|nr:uncharacterized protein BAUCODRAFT_35057 [Baudoinia panamericana UAMH 10762]EMC95062.1 hypothetical protein BAUCODRAFT_35057 [Baudoinia panamericana UAMH 10762]
MAPQASFPDHWFLDGLRDGTSASTASSSRQSSLQNLEGAAEQTKTEGEAESDADINPETIQHDSFSELLEKIREQCKSIIEPGFAFSISVKRPPSAVICPSRQPSETQGLKRQRWSAGDSHARGRNASQIRRLSRLSLGATFGVIELGTPPTFTRSGELNRDRLKTRPEVHV